VLSILDHRGSSMDCNAPVYLYWHDHVRPFWLRVILLALVSLGFNAISIFTSFYLFSLRSTASQLMVIFHGIVKPIGTMTIEVINDESLVTHTPLPMFFTP
jgi:capsule polysaccharide export protein KpsE/RkpR